MALNEIQKKERSEYLEKNLTITECSQNKKYVFISYASDNWETVFKDTVVPLQNEYGMRVYADKAFDKGNDKWIIPMLRNIRGAEAVVAFVSQSYIESYACFLELLTAVNNNVPVVFVSLNDELKLGATTDQPAVERGVKKEIIRQGDNLATKTNNTSNDTMRAMKSAYTSLSTLLEQDVLSKYDISDAFINFFRDASVNKKTINDLKALKRSVGSVSKNVFDETAVVKSKPVEQTAANIASVPAAPAAFDEPAAEAKSPAPAQGAPAALAEKPEPKAAGKLKSIFGDPKKRNIIIAAALVVIVAVVIIVLNAGRFLSGKDNVVTDIEFADFIYTGEWSNDAPNGQGRAVYENGNVYEGEWKDGSPNGYGTETGNFENGNGRWSYEGEWKDGQRNGKGKDTAYNENGKATFVHNGEWKDGKTNGQGKEIYNDENGRVTGIYEGEWKEGNKDGSGVFTSYDEYGNVKSSQTEVWQNGSRIT